VTFIVSLTFDLVVCYIKLQPWRRVYRIVWKLSASSSLITGPTSVFAATGFLVVLVLALRLAVLSPTSSSECSVLVSDWSEPCRDDVSSERAAAAEERAAGLDKARRSVSERMTWKREVRLDSWQILALFFCRQNWLFHLIHLFESEESLNQKSWSSKASRHSSDDT